MARWNGGIINKSGDVPSTSVATGAWTLSDQARYVSSLAWPTTKTKLYDFTTATFTPGVATGMSGPTLSQAIAGLTGPEASSWKTNSKFFTTSNGIQIWTVPVTGTYTIEAIGANGGTGSRQGRGGYGAIISGSFILQQGEKIQILVGQAGSNTTNATTYNQPAGGGGSFVVRYPYNTTDSILVIAGGGGGGGVGDTVVNQSTSDASLTNDGKTAAGTASGPIGTGGTLGSGGGDGSSYGGGGAGFSGIGGHASTARAQAFIAGGVGGQNTTTNPNSYVVQGGFGGGGGAASSTGFGSGSGGGGYSGGGGIYSASAAAEGFGGGGGSYNSGTNQTATLRNSAGPGQVKITLASLPPAVPSNPYTVTSVLTAFSTTTTSTTNTWSASVSTVPPVTVQNQRHIVIAAACRNSVGMTSYDWITSLTVNGIECPTIYRQYSTYNGAALTYLKADLSGTLTLVASGSLVMAGGYQFTVWVIDGPNSATPYAYGFSSVANTPPYAAAACGPYSPTSGSSAFFCGAASNSTAPITLSPLDGRPWTTGLSQDIGSNEFSLTAYTSNYSTEGSFGTTVNNNTPANGAAGQLLVMAWY